jgi:hypothetical protein
LSTTSIVEALETIEHKLEGKLLTANPQMRAIYRDIREDLANELAGRQLSFWDSPKGAED